MKAMIGSMSELEMVLRDHARRYPRMQPTDAVKLIYQNEFGGGHLIRDEESFLAYLRREYAAIPKDSTRPACETLGNGIVRVHLAALQEKDLEALGKAFIRSATAHTGSLESFIRKLALLQTMTQQGQMPFTPQALEEYLTAYRAAGYPMVSHSQMYRDVYAPAYRIVLEKWLPEGIA